MARRYSCSYKTEAMEESIECAFESMVDRKDFAEALDFIGACLNKVPHYTVIRTIIFKIIMDQECEKKVALQAAHYLTRILTIHQPSDCNRRIYYKSALISGNNEFLNLWTAFCHFVESSFCHHRIYYMVTDAEDNMKPVQYPNCDILVEFYIKVFLDSYEYLSSERTFYEKKEKSLVAELFWPSEPSELNAAKENPRKFLKWMNDIYGNSARIQKVSVFKSLHQLLNLMVKCIIAMEYTWNKNDILNTTPDSLIYNSSCLLDIVKVVINTCKEAFISHEHLRRLMNHITLKYLRIKLCEYRLYELIYGKQPSERKSSPTTLEDIINVYMFHKERGRPPRQKPTEQNKEKLAPKLVLKLNFKGDTKLHSACRLDKPADLYELLNSNPVHDVNARNSVGYTPLHVACISEAFLCAKVLIDECSSEDSQQKLNFNATDAAGMTPLHVAIQKNVCDITKLILKKGGTKLLHAMDHLGRKPNHLVCSEDMEKLLKEFLTPEEEMEDSILSSIHARSITHLKNFKDFALFFHALHFLLSYYSDIFHLTEVLKMTKNDPSQISVRDHKEKLCPHFTVCEENAVCSIDYMYLKHLTEICGHFIRCATDYTEKKGLKLDLELLPLKMYMASLNS